MKHLAIIAILFLAACGTTPKLQTTIQPGTVADAITTAAAVGSDRVTEMNPLYSGLTPVEALVAHTVLNIAAKELLVAGGSDPVVIDRLWNAGGWGVVLNNVLAFAGATGAAPIAAGGLFAWYIWETTE